MKKLLLALVLSLFCVAPSYTATGVSPTAQARATVRLMKNDHDQSCSAVVVAPGKVLTAAHCLVMHEPVVDGKKITAVTVHKTQDIALLTVPGIQCPCARLAPRRPAMEEALTLVGFLYGDMQLATRGEYQGRVVYDDLTYGIVSASGGPGTSGGGVFMIYVTGDVLLVGIISRGPTFATPTLYVEVLRDFKELGLQ